MVGERIAYKSLYSTVCLYKAAMDVTMQPHREYQQILQHSSV